MCPLFDLFESDRDFVRTDGGSNSRLNHMTKTAVDIEQLISTHPMQSSRSCDPGQPGNEKKRVVRNLWQQTKFHKQGKSIQ